MSKNKTPDKAVAAKSEEKNQEKKVAENKPKAPAKEKAPAPVKEQEPTSKEQDAPVKEQKEVLIDVTEGFLESNPELKEAGIEVGDMITIEELEDAEEQAEKKAEKSDKEQYDEIQKLKAVAYNQYPGMMYKRLLKPIAFDKLENKKSLPDDITFHSEILLDNGMIYTQHEGLTARKDEESVKSFIK